MRVFYVYILAKHRHGALYVGVTNDLIRRVCEHREGLVSGFTKRHGIKQLVYFEQHDDPIGAITHEKQIKKWRRDWKIDLIERDNPDWHDRFEEIAS